MATGFAAAGLAYPLLRASQGLFTAEPRPLAVVVSLHAGYLWRMLTVGYGGALVTFPAYVAARYNPGAVARALAILAPAAAVAVLVQATLVP